MSNKEERIIAVKQIIKGALFSVFCTVIGVLIFALIIKIANLGEGVIKTVNQFIKIVSLFLGASFSIKENKGLIKGLILGGFYALIVSLVFRLLGGGYSTFLSFILDFIFCLLVGAIFGIILINTKNK